MTSRLIVNPVAGSDRGADVVAGLNEQLRRHFGGLDIVITTAEGDARLAARHAAGHGYDRLFVAGGDGTLNEALNGVCDVSGALSRVSFGIVPIGTGNDFAAVLGIPDDLEAAVAAFAAGHVQLIDVGRLNGEHFVNVSAGGFIAEVSDAVTPQMKTIAGRLAYLLGGAQTLLTHDPVRVRYRDAAGERALAIETFAVCNSRLVGGGRLIAPDAVLDDGALDVCLIEEMPVMEFVRLLRRVSDGGHVDDPRVSYFRTPQIELLFDRRVKVNMDGQVLEADRCVYSVLPRAARFLTGAPNSGAPR